MRRKSFIEIYQLIKLNFGNNSDNYQSNLKSDLELSEYDSSKNNDLYKKYNILVDDHYNFNNYKYEHDNLSQISDKNNNFDSVKYVNRNIEHINQMLQKYNMK